MGKEETKRKIERTVLKNQIEGSGLCLFSVAWNWDISATFNKVSNALKDLLSGTVLGAMTNKQLFLLMFIYFLHRDEFDTT